MWRSNITHAKQSRHMWHNTVRTLTAQLTRIHTQTNHYQLAAEAAAAAVLYNGDRRSGRNTVEKISLPLLMGRGLSSHMCSLHPKEHPIQGSSQAYVKTPYNEKKIGT